MVKKILNYAWTNRAQVAKYLIVGIGGVILDISSLAVLKEVFGWTPVAAVIVNQAVLMTANFTLNKYWTFRNTEMPHKQAVRYLMLAAWNYSFSIASMYLFHDQLGYNYLLVRAGSIAAMTSWNFILFKTWVYRNEIQN